MNKDLESVLDFIRTHTEKEIALFDLKDLWKKDITKYTVKKMKQEVSEAYKIGKTTPLKKMCCYKIAAEPLKIDCDTSLFTMVVFRLLFKVSGTKLEHTKQKYQLTGHGFTCVGDTMNTYETATRHFIKTNYQNDQIYMPDRKGYLKWEYQNVSRTNPWEVAILDHYDEIEKLLPIYIKKFIPVIDTIGNMIPVPDTFNGARSNFTDDYWDITLEGMYQQNFEKIIGPSTRSRWSRKENVETCEKWFSNYENWEDFVKQTYMNPFVDDELKPKLLCQKKKNKHSKRIPVNEKEYEIFYKNATELIIKRGMIIATELKKIVDKKTNEQIIKKYFKMGK